MRLDLLLQRENFLEIFSQSFQQELYKQFGWSGQLIWERKYLQNLFTDALLVNHRLNVIYPNTICRKDLRQITAEYAYHPSLLRRLLQMLFVRFATSFPFELLTTKEVIKVDPWLKEIDKWCIVPGNHSVRILYLDKNVCRLFCKQGFSDKFIKNEIYVRKKYPFLPIPCLLDSDEDESWFLEERIIALPLNRIADQQINKEIISQARNALLELYRKSSQPVRLDEWAQNISSSLHEAIESLPSIYKQHDRNKFYYISTMLSKLVSDADEEWIDTVQSHGDFQPANIMVTTEDGVNQLYLIDWEYSQQRCLFYDAMVFSSQARSPKGLKFRLDALLSGSDESYLWCGCDKLQKWMLALFLMEDLLLKLQELQIPDLKQKGTGLSQWMEEVNTFLEKG